MIYDCAIIGGGPAGLNAALVLGRARRRVALLDSNRPRNAVTQASHGFITRDGVTPAEFRRIAYEEVLRYPLVDHVRTEVMALNRTASGFEVLDSSGHRLQARKVILATGVKEVFPEIEGFYPLYGKSLFNCPYCDGWELQDQPLVIVSESPSVFHMAKLLLNWSKDLVVCTNGKVPLPEEQIQRLQSLDIAVMEQPVAAFVGKEGQQAGSLRGRNADSAVRRLRDASLGGKRSVRRTVGLGQDGIGRDQDGSRGRTSIPGLYAAGDASYFAPSQVVFAAADGSRTAMSVNMDLTEEDYG